MISASEALQNLKDGNRRYVSDVPRRDTFSNQVRRAELVDRQQPPAMILGCADSRVPTEIIFDQGPGDLFVIRVAGNIAAPSQVGSIEYAAERFGTRLVVVLGHEGCGAVRTTLETIARPVESLSPNLRSIVDRIRPSVESLMETDLRHDPVALVQQAVLANIRATVDSLRHGSAILGELIENEGLLVVGAHYSLATRAVEFLDEPSENN
jgi:carbonic anhydrase